MEQATELLTAQELAKHLRLSPETVHEWARSGAIPSLRLSPKVIRFDIKAVMSALASAPTKGVADARQD